jgi:hypothetical protein
MCGIHGPDFIIKIREQNLWLNYYINSLFNFISLNLKENYETVILVRLYMKKLDPLI